MSWLRMLRGMSRSERMMGSREVEICHKCGDWDYPWGGCSCDEPSREGERLSYDCVHGCGGFGSVAVYIRRPQTTGRSPVSPSTCVSLSRLRSLIPEIPSSDDAYRMLSRNALRDIHLCLAEAEAVAQDQQRQAQQLPDRLLAVGAMIHQYEHLRAFGQREGVNHDALSSADTERDQVASDIAEALADLYG